MTADVHSIIRDGRYECPVEECGARFHTLADKKHHVRVEHPRPKAER